MFTYGRMVPVRGVDTPNPRALQTERSRKPEFAVREKLKVLEEFDIVNECNRKDFEQKLWEAIKASPDIHFDRVLDGFARKLISEKLGG